MLTPPSIRSRLARSALASLAAAAAVLCWSVPVSAAPKATPAPPQLSIAMDNGLDSAASGDELSYVITLTNVGTEDVDDLLVTQSLPPGTSLVSADAKGDEKSGQVQWKVDLKATEKATFKTSLKLEDTPAEVLRLATVACAKVSAKAAPVVCASDSDILPAGEAAAEAEAKASLTTRTSPFGRTAVYIGAGIMAAGAAAILLVLRSRRRVSTR